jgi:branched-chain amino acid transport system permease protein
MGGLILVLALGSLYAVLAAAVVIVYRTSRVLNLAVGEMAIVGAYVAATFIDVLPGGPVVGALASLLVAALGGLVLYALVMRRILGEPPFVGILVTVALAILLRAVIILIWGGSIRTMTLLGSGALSVGGFQTRFSDVTTLGVSVLTFGLVYFLYQQSRLGLQMRAVAENVVLAAQRGIDLNRTVALAWMVAAVVGSVAGILYGDRAVLDLFAAVIGLKGVTAALVGGLDSLKGALVGGLTVAAAEYGTVIALGARFSELAPIVILLIVLLVRPWGIFGTAEEVERV